VIVPVAVGVGGVPVTVDEGVRLTVGDGVEVGGVPVTVGEGVWVGGVPVTVGVKEAVAVSVGVTGKVAVITRLSVP
jgi:hypothetical protein